MLLLPIPAEQWQEDLRSLVLDYGHAVFMINEDLDTELPFKALINFVRIREQTARQEADVQIARLREGLVNLQHRLMGLGTYYRDIAVILNATNAPAGETWKDIAARGKSMTQEDYEAIRDNP